MLPRRCKKCSCFIAPHLDACPRCGKSSPKLAAAVKLTKEEKKAERAKLDTKVTVISGKKIHWIPSAFSLRAQTDMLAELRKRLEREESIKLRNAIRSELRLVKEHLTRATVPAGKHGWTTEIFHTKHGCISVFISPKKHRYVRAERDVPADLIIESHKPKQVTMLIRLQRFEKSKHARLLKKEKQEDVVHSKRRKEKKVHRAKKRLLKRTKV